MPSHRHASVTFATTITHHTIYGHILQILSSEGRLLRQWLHCQTFFHRHLQLLFVRPWHLNWGVGCHILIGLNIIKIFKADMVISQVGLERFIINELEATFPAVELVPVLDVLMFLEVLHE